MHAPKKLVLLCSLFLLALCAFTPVQAQYQGPCRRYTAFPPTAVRKCEVTCFAVCLDPCKRYHYVPGACLHTQPVSCTEITITVPKRRCRDCFCPIAGPLCLDFGLYPSGTVDITDCI